MLLHCGRTSRKRYRGSRSQANQGLAEGRAALLPPGYFLARRKSGQEKIMDQFEVLEMEQVFDKCFCLADLPEVSEEVDPQVFKLVVETTNYRVEIEIG
jgi:hypothetical protein